MPPNTVTSRDGTSIGYDYASSHPDNPPLVLVHGISADAERWSPVMKGLAESFAVHAMDRRGRGLSGDATEYAIERELEDITASRRVDRAARFCLAIRSVGSSRLPGNVGLPLSARA